MDILLRVQIVLSCFVVDCSRWLSSSCTDGSPRFIWLSSWFGPLTVAYFVIVVKLWKCVLALSNSRSDMLMYKAWQLLKNRYQIKWSCMCGWLWSTLTNKLGMANVDVLKITRNRIKSHTVLSSNDELVTIFNLIQKLLKSFIQNVLALFYISWRSSLFVYFHCKLLACLCFSCRLFFNFQSVTT